MLFEEHNSFTETDERLRNLAPGHSGVGEDDLVNCDMANDVSHRVMIQGWLSFDAITLKKCDQANTLGDVKVHNASVDEKFAIDPVVCSLWLQCHNNCL